MEHTGTLKFSPLLASHRSAGRPRRHVSRGLLPYRSLRQGCGMRGIPVARSEGTQW